MTLSAEFLSRSHLLHSTACSSVVPHLVATCIHSPLQRLGAEVRFPDLGTEGKNARGMSGSVIGPLSSRESGESKDKPPNLVEIGTRFLQRRVIPRVMVKEQTKPGKPSLPSKPMIDDLFFGLGAQPDSMRS